MGVSGLAAFDRKLRQDVATDRWAASTEIREADRSHASGPTFATTRSVILVTLASKRLLHIVTLFALTYHVHGLTIRHA